MPTDRRERKADLGVALRAALEGWEADLWTALPGEIIRFDAERCTADVQATVQAQVTDAGGERAWVTLPPLVDCPVVFPSGGGFTLTFPVRAGDEVLVVFASRCIDAWWQSGGVQAQAELRMHSLSDGFALPGPRSLARKLPALSATEVQLRNDAGTARFAIDAGGNARVVTPGDASVQAGGSVQVNAQQVAITAPGGVTVTGDVAVSGKITATGEVGGSNFAPTVGPKYLQHKHNITGGSNLGPPVPYTG